MSSNDGIFYHCYQRTKDRGIIFYTVSDHLMYLTVMCIRSVLYAVKILKCVQMPDHTHHSVIEYEDGQLSVFIQDVTSTFTREYNKAHGRKGPISYRRYAKKNVCFSSK
ncbi:MAG: transposase [Bacteroidales bacterium]|nr:transposase [Bacteroidales bacterium]